MPVSKKKVKADSPAKDGEIVKVGSIITICDLTNESTDKYKIVDVEAETKYKGAGGAYYGAITETIYVSDAGKNIDGINIISRLSPFAYAILGKHRGEKFIFKQPNGYSIEYRIIDVS